MVSGINLGSFTKMNDQYVANGMASGFDSAAIINTLVEAKNVPIKKIEDQITLKTKKINAYNEFSSVLSNLQTSLDALRNSPGYNNFSVNAFEARTANISSNTSIPGNTYLGFVAQNGAEINDYNITITNLATSEIKRSNSFSSNNTSVVGAAGSNVAGKFNAGTFQINGVNVTLNQGDSLLNIVDEINATTEQSNVSAYLVQVSTTDFRLVIQSELTGSVNGNFTITDAQNCLTPVTFTTIQSGTDANFTFDSIPMTRSTNAIGDIIPNVTFTLYQPTPGGTIVTASILEDTNNIVTAMDNFVNAYNNYAKFVAKQSQRDETKTGTPFLDTAILGSDNLFQNMILEIYNEATSSATSYKTLALSTLSDVGITFQDIAATENDPQIPNAMSLNLGILAKDLTTSVLNVREVFEFRYFSTSPKFMIAERSNNLAVSGDSFTINVDTSKAVGQQVSLSYTDSLGAHTVYANFTANSNGGIITGQDGTVFSGMTIIWASSSTTDSATISYTQGIADKLYNEIDSYLTTINAYTANLLQEIEDENTEIDKLSFQLEEYRSFLLKKYAAMEEAIKKINTVLQLLDVQERARDSMSK